MNDLSRENRSDVSAGEEASQIEVHVLGRLAGRLRDFRVVVQDNGVVLQGHAPTYYVKQLAQQVALERTASRILTNEIEVS